MFKRLADRLIQRHRRASCRAGARRASRRSPSARATSCTKVSTFTGQINELVELFKPFTNDHDIAFRCDNIRALWARVTPADQDKLPVGAAPDRLARSTGSTSHFPGLRSGRSPSSTRSSARSRSRVYTYKELVEMFEATVKLHRNRPALRLLPTGREAREPIAYTLRPDRRRWRGRAPACCASAASRRATA